MFLSQRVAHWSGGFDPVERRECHIPESLTIDCVLKSVQKVMYFQLMHTQLWEAQGSSPMEVEADNVQFLFLIQDLQHTENSYQTLI